LLPKSNNMATKTWVLDPAHSEIQFKVKHLMITNVTGHFSDFAVTATTDGDDFTKGSIQFTAEVGSLSTGNEMRDGHLKSPDFFDAANHPQVKFTATRFEKSGDANYVLYGDLTLRETTKNIKLDVESGGVVKDGYGNTKAGFSVSGKIKRKEFGLNWDSVTEAGGVVVSDEVRIHCEIQLIEQA